MELGNKIRQARLEAGLSQRQLCGEQITRNMLSQIENGSAKPSMDTLRYLADKLGKSVSFFLEETVISSQNLPLMQQLRPPWMHRAQRQRSQSSKNRPSFRSYSFTSPMVTTLLPCRRR